METNCVTFAGEEIPLNYSIEVMFGAEEKFGGITNAMETIGNGGIEGFEALRWLFVRMANDGELCRREAGREPRPLLEEKDVSPRMSPKLFAELQRAVTEAVRRGYETEIANSKGQFIDLGLLELERKNPEAGRRRPGSATSR